MSVAVIAYGAASSLGVGRAAFDVGGAGAAARRSWSARARGRPFARVSACSSPREERPAALLALGLDELVRGLSARDPGFRERKLGVVIGTSSGGFAALERALAEPERADCWARSSYHAPLALVAERLGARPQRLVSLYAACASSTLALGLALRWLELGECELVIAGGYDAESDWVSAGFDALKATSAGVPRPFRAERDGMALGEGVALLALAAEATAPLGYLRGFAATTDAVHITAPDRTGDGLARAGAQALADAQLTPRDVRLVSAHGTGTAFNDAAEAAALRQLFGARDDLVLHAFKPAVGHTLGAAGALESLAALSALERGVLPASASDGTPMPELPARLLAHNEPAPLEHCLKLSTAFGGANAALVVSKRSAPTRARPRRAVYVAAAGKLVRELDPARLGALLLAPPERLPRGDRLSALAIGAAAEALCAAVDAGHTWDRARTGVVVGSVGASIEANAELGARIIARGPEHAEPRRFPATSPNACAGHVAIAFGLRGLSHAVGASTAAALEALEVAVDWLAAGDVDSLLVVAAEVRGDASVRALGQQGLAAPEEGGLSLLLTTTPVGPELCAASLAGARALAAEKPGFQLLGELLSALGLPERSGFGSVRRPE